jgi:hypothetical protein
MTLVHRPAIHFVRSRVVGREQLGPLTGRNTSLTVRLCLAQDTDADQLLSENPFTLLVGMLLDQQVPMETVQP